MCAKADEHLRALYGSTMRVLQSHGVLDTFGVGAMQTFRMDSNGWPVPANSPSSSHYARHRLSRRAFIGGAAAAAGGASLGSGLLWPTAGSAAPVSSRAPKPTTATVVINGLTF